MQPADSADMPVEVQIYPGDSMEYISARFTGEKREKLGLGTVRDTIENVLFNYDPEISSPAAKAELERILPAFDLGKSNPLVKIYGQNLPVLKQGDAVLVDHTQERIKDDRFFKVVEAADGTSYWLCEIRIYEDLEERTEPVADEEAVVTKAERNARRKKVQGE